MMDLGFAVVIIIIVAIINNINIALDTHMHKTDPGFPPS